MQACILTEEKRSYRNLANMHWVITHQGDLTIHLVMEWLKRRKDNHWPLDNYLKYHVLDAKQHIYTACQKDFML